MGFWSDILSALKPEFKVEVKIDQSNTDNRKVVIQDSKIIYGNKIIDDKNIIDKVFAEIEAQKGRETYPFQLIHKSLEDDFSDYEEITIKEKESIKRLNNVLGKEDMECILMARRVVLAFERGDKPFSEQLLKQLEKNFPKKGKKVYNLVGCKYFDEIIIPFIEIYKEEVGEEKYKDEFRKFYKGILNFFPLAVFVGNETSNDVLKEEIKRRLSLKIPFIRIHAVGKINIDKVEEVTTDLGIEDRFTVKNNTYNTAVGHKAQIYEIRLGKE